MNHAKAQHQASSLKDDVRMQAEPDFQEAKDAALFKKKNVFFSWLIMVINNSCFFHNMTNNVVNSG